MGKRDRRFVVYVDFDGTLCKFNAPQVGKPNKKLIKIMCKYRPFCYYMIWTTRSAEDRDKIKNFLIRNDVPWDEIILNKPYYHLYIDDSSVHPGEAVNKEELFFIKLLESEELSYSYFDKLGQEKIKEELKEARKDNIYRTNLLKRYLTRRKISFNHLSKGGLEL